MNGLYLQLHAYMLRVAVPYGSLDPRQMRALADIARRFDRGYGHFTTRTNIQFNWIRLADAPEILDVLAAADLHAIQTSGNCIRNVTADPYAGAAADELEDPRVWCEAIRQWSSLHPEFSFLPRKFKIAVTASPHDRTAAKVHDIGLLMRRGRDGATGFEVIVGGGMGRTPHVGPTLKAFLPSDRLFSYLEAVLRVYNRHGRRDNIYKARIKILVAALGAEAFGREVEAEWEKIGSGGDLPGSEIARIRDAFTRPDLANSPEPGDFEARRAAEPAFARFVRNNLKAHKLPGYAIVDVSLKGVGETPGDITADQMDVVADLAERFGQGEIRSTHEQNLVLPHIRLADVHEVWKALDAARLATPNINLISDIIACPGLDYCALANARAICVAQDIARRFEAPDRAEAIGELKIKISGCINACGHHHVGHIGVLGVDKHGEEWFQVTIGGHAGNRPGQRAAFGRVIGPSFSAAEVAPAIERMIERYISLREHEDETFVEVVERVGIEPFRESAYADSH